MSVAAPCIKEASLYVIWRPLQETPTGHSVEVNGEPSTNEDIYNIAPASVSQDTS